MIKYGAGGMQKGNKIKPPSISSFYVLSYIKNLFTYFLSERESGILVLNGSIGEIKT